MGEEVTPPQGGGSVKVSHHWAFESLGPKTQAGGIGLERGEG